jgi:hypothetical protein
VGGALDFRGPNDAVSIGSPAALTDLPRFTLTLWINPRTFGARSVGRLADKRNSGAGWALLACDNSVCAQTFEFHCPFDGAEGVWQTAPGAVRLGVWQHIAVAYDRSSADNTPLVYIEATPATVVRTKQPSGAPSSDMAQPLILGNREAGDSAFDGLIDDVRIYDRLLAPEEVATLHAQSR